MIQVYRIINKIDNIDFDFFFKYNTSPTRGHSEQLEKPRATKTVRQNNFSHRVINPWNALPDEVVNCTSVNSFKNALERAWQNKEDKYNEI